MLAHYSSTPRITQYVASYQLQTGAHLLLQGLSSVVEPGSRVGVIRAQNLRTDVDRTDAQKIRLIVLALPTVTRRHNISALFANICQLRTLTQVPVFTALLHLDRLEHSPVIGPPSHAGLVEA